MTKFKEFIITKILREPLYTQPIKQLFIREERPIDRLRMQLSVDNVESSIKYADLMAQRLAKRLLDEKYIEFTELPSYIPNSKIIEARVDVVRRSNND